MSREPQSASMRGWDSWREHMTPPPRPAPAPKPPTRPGPPKFRISVPEKTTEPRYKTSWRDLSPEQLVSFARYPEEGR